MPKMPIQDQRSEISRILDPSRSIGCGSSFKFVCVLLSNDKSVFWSISTLGLDPPVERRYGVSTVCKYT